MTSAPILEYRDGAAEQNGARARWLGRLAGLMAAAAVAIVVWYQRETWNAAARNVVLDIICVMTLAGSLVAIARAFQVRWVFVTRFAWIGLATDFGFWTVIILSNQSHGRPPPSQAWMLGGCVSCLVLSAFGLALDRRVTFRSKRASDASAPPAH